jgi:hypothetical protein
MLCHCSKRDHEYSGLDAYEKRHNNKREKQQSAILCINQQYVQQCNSTLAHKHMLPALSVDLNVTHFSGRNF